MLPISVLIPTRNCASLVPGHVESIRPWIDLAEEIVVVDSDSKDGTVELLRQGLKHPRVRFLNHPPGLYQSWNFGIQNTTAKYIYISTVGDSMTRRGLEHLHEVAEKFQSDVVISKPEFIDEEGKPLPSERWPIDVVLDCLKIDQPRLLTTREQFFFATTNPWGAILGSSASNLYRAECLKPRPFPTEFGTAGDAGWGIMNIFDVTIAITPEHFSTFRYHKKAYSASDYHVESVILKLFRLAQTVIDAKAPGDPRVRKVLEEVRWTELVKAMEEARVNHDYYDRCRHQMVPWIFKPGAWIARSRRNKAEILIKEISRGFPIDLEVTRTEPKPDPRRDSAGKTNKSG